MTITPEEIARLRALEAKATPGPWIEGFLYWTLRGVSKWGLDSVYQHMDGSEITDEESGRCPSKEDAPLIVAARSALPSLLDEIEELRDELDFQKRLRVPCECSADDACKFARERDEARAELRAYKERTEAALTEFSSELSNYGGVPTNYYRQELRRLGLWREGGA